MSKGGKSMKKSARIRRTRFDVGFDIVATCLLVCALLVVLYPLYFVLIASVSDATSISIALR